MLLHQLYVPSIVVILLAAVAVVAFAHGLFWIELLRESRRLLALPAARATPPTGTDGSGD